MQQNIVKFGNSGYRRGEAEWGSLKEVNNIICYNLTQCKGIRQGNSRSTNCKKQTKNPLLSKSSICFCFNCLHGKFRLLGLQ